MCKQVYEYEVTGFHISHVMVKLKLFLIFRSKKTKNLFILTNFKKDEIYHVNSYRDDCRLVSRSFDANLGTRCMILRINVCYWHDFWGVVFEKIVVDNIDTEMVWHLCVYVDVQLMMSFAEMSSDKTDTEVYLIVFSCLSDLLLLNVFLNVVCMKTYYQMICYTHHICKRHDFHHDCDHLDNVFPNAIYVCRIFDTVHIEKSTRPTDILYT